MNKDANPFFGTNQPSQVSWPDELLARERDLAVFYDTTKPLVDRMVCAARAIDSLRSANAALATRCGELERIGNFLAWAETTENGDDLAEAYAELRQALGDIRAIGDYVARALAKESES